MLNEPVSRVWLEKVKHLLYLNGQDAFFIQLSCSHRIQPRSERD